MPIQIKDVSENEKMTDISKHKHNPDFEHFGKEPQESFVDSTAL